MYVGEWYNYINIYCHIHSLPLKLWQVEWHDVGRLYVYCILFGKNGQCFYIKKLGIKWYIDAIRIPLQNTMRSLTIK